MSHYIIKSHYKTTTGDFVTEDSKTPYTSKSSACQNLQFDTDPLREYYPEMNVFRTETELQIYNGDILWELHEVFEIN